MLFRWLWQNFGDLSTYENSREMILSAFSASIMSFDLANNYGPPPGSAEETFGRILKQDLKAYRDELFISTKAEYYMCPGPFGEWGSKKNLMASLDQSLMRMGLNYVDIFYSHRPDPQTPFEETMDALVCAVRQGKALYVGLSNYSVEQAGEALDILDRNGVHCLLHQPRYSMLKRWVEDELLNLLSRRGVRAIPFSPLAQGLLSGRYLYGIPEGARASHTSSSLKPSELTPTLMEEISKLDLIARQRSQTLAQMALAWVLRMPQVSSVIIGASSWHQIQENMKCIDGLDFSPEELAGIDSILSA